MSKRATDSISRQTMQPYQPLWMARWMQASNKSTRERCDDSAQEIKELNRVSKDEDSTYKFENETESLRVSPKSMGKEAMHSSPIKQDTDEIQARRPITSQDIERDNGGIQFPAAKGAFFRKYHSISEGTSKNPHGLVKTHERPIQERFDGSSTHIVPYENLERHGFDKGKSVVGPSRGRPSIVSENQFPNRKLRIMEHCQNHSESVGLICERKMVSQPEPDKSTNECFGKCNSSLLLDSPSLNQLPAVGQDWFQKIPNCSRITLLPDQFIASEKNDSRIPCYDHYSPHKLPTCAHDMKAMRICTTVDSVEAMPGGVPRFSQTTHSLLFTKKTDVNLSKENDMFRRLITKMSGKPSTDPHYVPPFFGQANRGVKLQPLSSSSNSEGLANFRNIGIGTSKVAIKNESSAETDTMDMDLLKDERLQSGSNLTRSTKFDAASSREVDRRWTKIGTPDINLELPPLPAAASSSENAGPRSSRTQSLEMDTLLAHAEHPSPKSNIFLDDSFKPDPTTRWVKRLKSSSSDSSGQGTKSSNLSENPSHDKKRTFFRSILKNSISGRETSLSNRSRGSSKVEEHFTVDPGEEGKEVLHSHTWIKRWLRKGSQTKPETRVVCEPQSSKLSLDDLQKKQFPSIAAMALMGKAMSGFQSCELQKKGSFTVWNTKAF